MLTIDLIAFASATTRSCFCETFLTYSLLFISMVSASLRGKEHQKCFHEQKPVGPGAHFLFLMSNSLLVATSVKKKAAGVDKRGNCFVRSLGNGLKYVPDPKRMKSAKWFLEMKVKIIRIDGGHEKTRPSTIGQPRPQKESKPKKREGVKLIDRPLRSLPWEILRLEKGYMQPHPGERDRVEQLPRLGCREQTTKHHLTAPRKTNRHNGFARWKWASLLGKKNAHQVIKCVQERERVVVNGCFARWC